MTEYVALVWKEDGTDFTVEFPDFPGCYTTGKNMNDAQKLAEKVLTLHIKAMKKKGDSIPKPMNWHTIMANPEYRGAHSFAVRPKIKKPKAVHINITLQQDELDKIDQARKIRGVSRSSYLRTAAALMTNG